MTIVNPDKLTLRGNVTEANLSKFKPGMEGTATLVSQPDQKFNVRIEEVGTVYLVTGGFEVKLTPTSKLPEPITPGMTCKVTFEKAAK
jgi:multidrug resistance efflux pump